MTHARRIGGLASLVVTALLATALPAGAGDLDDDGFDDLAVGAPYRDLSAGMGGVTYGTVTGLGIGGADTLIQGDDLPGSADDGDFFASTFATGDFDGDGFDDLAVGARFDHIGGDEIGSVTVIPGGPDGLRYAKAKLWTQDTKDVKGKAAHKDEFGDSLAVGNFGRSGHDDLAISAPADSVNGETAAGVVHILYGSPNGLTAEGNQLFNQDSERIKGTALEQDVFGDSLAAGDVGRSGHDDLIVGIPVEDAGPGSGGAVGVLYGSRKGVSARGNQLITMNPDGIPGDPAAGDTFGASLATGNFGGSNATDLARRTIGSVRNWRPEI